MIPCVSLTQHIAIKSNPPPAREGASNNHASEAKAADPQKWSNSLTQALVTLQYLGFECEFGSPKLNERPLRNFHTVSCCSAWHCAGKRYHFQVRRRGGPVGVGSYRSSPLQGGEEGQSLSRKWTIPKKTYTAQKLTWTRVENTVFLYEPVVFRVHVSFQWGK